MADQGEHGIPYVDWTWNICRGCSPVSPGCANCFAPRNTARVAGPGRPYEGLVKSTSVGPRWTGEVRLAAEILDTPLRMRTPSRIYVTVTGDPFHEKHTDDEIDAWLGGVAAAPWHTFICTTKRADRMRRHVSTIRERAGDRFLIPALIGHAAAFASQRGHGKVADRLHKAANAAAGKDVWPLPHLHLGVSVENQPTADERIPELLQTPAAVRWVSYEPALEAVGFTRWLPCPRGGPDRCGNRPPTCAQCDSRRDCNVALDGIVVGGESGPGARPCDPAWLRAVVEQGKAAGTPVFVKQMGRWVLGDHTGFQVNHWLLNDGRGFVPPIIGPHAHTRPPAAIGFSLWDHKGANPMEWPVDLRVREFPR